MTKQQGIQSLQKKKKESGKKSLNKEMTKPSSTARAANLWQGRTRFLELPHHMSECPVFNKKVTRHTEKQKTMVHSQWKKNRNWQKPPLRKARRRFTRHRLWINYLKYAPRAKGNTRTMSVQTWSLNKETGCKRGHKEILELKIQQMTWKIQLS